MKRRSFLALAAASAASSLAAPYVQAQAKKFAGVTLRINGYGGAYDAALTEGVARPLEEKFGLKVEYIAGQTQADMVKLIVNKDNPPFDLFMGDSPHMVEVTKAGVVEPITASDAPAISRILPGFREFGDFGAPFSVASVVPVYNSKHIKEPLKSYSDIARPDLKDRVVIPTQSSTANSLMLLAIAEKNGGSISDMEPAFKIMGAAKPNIMALAQTNVAQVQFFANEEAYAGIFWDGRAHELRTKNVPIVTVVPPEGIYAVSSYINIVKGTKYREAANAYVDQMLSDQGMLALPRVLRYGITTGIKLPEDIAKELLFNSQERFALKKKIDWPALMANRNGWIERLNKELRT